MKPPEAVYRHVNCLVEQKRVADALLVAETAAKMPEMKGADGAQLRALVEQLKNSRTGSELLDEHAKHRGFPLNRHAKILALCR